MVCCSEPLFVFTVFSPFNLRWRKVRCVSDGRGSSTWVLPNDIGKTPRSWYSGTVSMGTTKNQRKKHGWCHVVTTQIATSSCFFVDIFHLTHGFCLFCWDVFFWKGLNLFVEGEDFYVNVCLW